MRNFLYVLIVMLPVCSAAQPGHFFLSHFAPADKKVDHVAFDMVQDANGLLFFATRAGILQFDGRNWDLIQGSGAVYAMEIDAQGTIYWGGAQGFGSLARGRDGRMLVETRSEGVTDIFQVSAGEKEVYFLNDEALFISEARGTVRTIHAGEKSGAFTSLVEIYGIPYVSTERSIVFKLQNQNELAPVVLDPDIDEILFSSRYDDKYLIGTSDNKLYICDEDLVMRELALKEREYLNASVVVGGGWMTDRLVTIATLRGGVLFVDPITGSIKELVDYNTGLPDNEIYSLYIDDNQNVWVSHDYGLTRIAPFLPFRSYSNYEGLQGNLLCVQTHNGSVYVGTSLGLFKLVKEEVYEEISYYIDVPAQREALSGESNQRKDVSGRPKKRRGLFGFLKKDIDQAGSPEPARGLTEKEKRVRKILRSERFVYRPVKGIKAKVSGLTQANGKLLASGLAGLFEIDDLMAIPLLEEPVRLVFATKDHNLVVPMYDDKVQLLARGNAGWMIKDALNNPTDYVSQVFEGQNGELWLCGMDIVQRVSIEDGKFSDLRVISIHNPNFSKVVGFSWDDKITLANANGFFQFDGQSGSLISVDSLAVPRAYYASSGQLVFSDAHAWRVLGSGTTIRDINALSLLNDVRGVSATDDNGSLWVIDGNDGLYKFSGSRALRPGVHYPLLLRSATQAGQPVNMPGRVVMDQEGGPVTFNVVQPNYLGPSEYRYYLEGVGDHWSDWSALNSQITFPYLPSGNYTLHVQSKDILGTLYEMRSIPLRVRPLFWKSSWFYGMELAIFGVLGWLSLKLSIRYRLLSRLLALLTIIMLIEFIQTLAGYSFSTSSPIADFLLQVAVALLILPVEGYLRKVMFRSGHKSRLLAVIEELNAREKE